MYYQNKPRGFRSSVRGGSSQRSYSRPSNGGGFNNRPNFSRGRFSGRQVPKVFNDPAVFVKKATASLETDYTPTNSFEDFNIVSLLKENILAKGYTKPTPIQDQAIKPLLEGRDLIGLANTGTGKTAAFLIPLIDKIFRTRDQKALIIAPTRELAVQINDEFRSFSKGMRVYSALIIGGANFNRQVHEVRRNPHVVIATPGRLKDLIERRVIHLEDFSNIVLDEVDLMVDIGFIDDVKYFIGLMPKVRQSLFFSATIPHKIQGVLQAFVTNPVTVSVKLQDTAENVDQDIIKVISKEKKIDQLHDLLISDGFDKVLIFGRTKHGVEDLHKALNTRGFKTGAIHGNKTQGHRQRILQSFKRDEIQILLATDVASRGLDIENVTHVINYDLPESYDDYVHRIGRTGRAGKTGVALTFV